MNLFEKAFDLWRMFDQGSYTSDAQMLQFMHEALGQAYAQGFEDGYDHSEADAGQETTLVRDPMPLFLVETAFTPTTEPQSVTGQSNWYQDISGVWHEYAPDMGPRLG